MKKKRLEKNYHQKIFDNLKKKKINLGVMQGRLVPKYKKRYQAFPVDDWQKEFEIASKLKLKFIEFIFDKGQTSNCPLFYHDGRNEISKLSNKYKIKILSVCSDYFMYNPLIKKNNNINKNSKKILVALIKNCSKLNIKNIVLPFVDQSSLENNIHKMQNLIELLNNLEALLKECKVKLALETDLSPQVFQLLISNIKNPNIKINYDLGNSASLGYDINEEFLRYGKYISVIHIKDRKFNGKSVYLGKGNVNFKKFFRNYKNLKSRVPLTLQTYRDQKGIDLFKKQYIWFTNKLINSYNDK